MNLKLQLKILSFLQFCLWGSWLTTLGSYMFVTPRFWMLRQSVPSTARSVLRLSSCQRCWGSWRING